MSKMLSVTIKGLCESSIERIGELLEAAHAVSDVTPARKRADKKLINYHMKKLREAK